MRLIRYAASVFTADRLSIRKDPTLLFLFFSPLFMATGLGILIPMVREQLLLHLDFNLDEYLPLITGMFMMLPPLLSGSIFGLLFLEERDRGIQDAYAVTPLGRSGFLSIRLMLLLLACIFFELIFYLVLSLFIPLVTPFLSLRHFFGFVLLFSAASLQGVFLLPIMGLTASDRIAGLALVKAFSVTIIIPIAWFFTPPIWGRVLHLLYPVPIVHAFIRLQSGQKGAVSLSILALALEFAILFLLWRAIKKAKILPLKGVKIVFKRNGR